MTLKRISFIIPIFILCFIGCEKNTTMVSELETPDSASAYIKIAYLSNPATNPSVQVKLNDVRVSTLINYATGFPGGGTNINVSNTTDYLPVASGTSISFSIPKAGTNTDSVLLYKTTLTIGAREKHTLFVVDTFPNMSSFLVKDELERPDSGLIKFRFVHAIPNVPAVDVYKNATLLASNVAYKSATGYLTTPVGASDTFKIRIAGASPTATPLSSRPFSTSNQRIYNFMSRGYNGAAPAARAPMISNVYTW